MLRTILKREILHNLYSLRFQVSLVLVLTIFIVGSVSFVKSHEAGLKKYQEVQAQFVEEMRAQAKADATDLAVRRKTYTLRPRDNAFIYDANAQAGKGIQADHAVHLVEHAQNVITALGG